MTWRVEHMVSGPTPCICPIVHFPFSLLVTETSTFSGHHTIFYYLSPFIWHKPNRTLRFHRSQVKNIFTCVEGSGFWALMTKSAWSSAMFSQIMFFLSAVVCSCSNMALVWWMCSFLSVLDRYSWKKKKKKRQLDSISCLPFSEFWFGYILPSNHILLILLSVAGDKSSENSSLSAEACVSSLLILFFSLL